MTSWSRFWFSPDSSVNLAVMRIVAAGVALWILLSRDFAAVSALPADYWSSVSLTARARFLMVPSHEGVEHALLWLARGSAVCALAGIKPRSTSFITALLLYHIAPLDSIVWSSSPAGRGLTMPLLALMLCAAAPSGDSLAWGTWKCAAVGPQYTWSIRLMQVLLAQVYFFSGVAKLRRSGWAWGAGHNLRNWILLASQNDLVNVHTRAAAWISGHPALLSLAAAGTLAFELTFLLAFANKWLRGLYAAGAIAFHALIYVTINVTLNSWPLLWIFFDWAHAPAALDCALRRALHYRSRKQAPKGEFVRG